MAGVHLPRRYAQTATYSQMNNVDVFVQALLRPRPSLGLRVDLHQVGFASARDRWYFGSGATQARGTQFGFATRPSNDRTSLGTLLESSADERQAKTSAARCQARRRVDVSCQRRGGS